MTKHFTRNTVSAAAWCGKCERHTQHRIDGVKLGPCLDCIAALEAQHVEPKEEKPEVKQGKLEF
jgi:ribosomal protein L44E